MTMSPKAMTPYEKHAQREIDVFKNPEATWLTTAWDRVTKPIEGAMNFAFDTPVGHAVMRAIEGIFGVLNDGASWSVRTDAIYAEFVDDGHDVHAAGDILRLPLDAADRTLGRLGAK